MAAPTPAPHVIHPLHRRQQPGGSQSSQNSNSQASGSNSNSQASGSNSNSQASGSNSQSVSGSQSQSPSTAFPIVPSTAAAGGLLFTQPPQTAAASFYKIAPSQQITFGWNFTSLIITPSALTVSAFCADNGNTYPVGPTDGVIPGTATQVVWDAFSYDQAHPSEPLVVASYTLQIQDGHGFTQPPLPGRFSPNQQMTFALYRPQSYTPLASWTCNGCSSAAPAASVHPIFLALFTALFAMVLGGWGVLRRR